MPPTKSLALFPDQTRGSMDSALIGIGAAVTRRESGHHQGRERFGLHVF